MVKHCGNCVYLRRGCPVETWECVNHSFSHWTTRRERKIMDCLDIVIKYLKDNGYDGLHFDAECGCEIDNLAPCGNSFSECIPGYKVTPPAETDCDYDFYICDSPCDRPWED